MGRRVLVITIIACALASMLPLRVAAQSPSPSGSASPSSSGSPTSADPSPEPSRKPLVETKPGRTTDTEYLKVRIDSNGNPTAAWLKNWIRLRGSGERTVTDPGVFAGVEFLDGTPAPAQRDDALEWKVGIGSDGYRDLYYEGRVQQAGDYWVTPEGLKPLPIDVDIRYYTGDEGSEAEATAKELEAVEAATRFKIVIALTNRTKRFEEVSYTDIQTKRRVIATAPVYTPYVARIAGMRFGDGDFDQIRSDGQITRDGNATVIDWTRNLVPPDFPETQTAIVTGVVARGATIPSIKIVAQPIYPPFDADALSGISAEFQKGRRNFFYDVFGLFRDNLVALTGLFGLLHDSFANLSLPLLGPDKGNREEGSFDKPNQLWALWTLAKGMEQLDRAFNVFDSTSQILRDATKGSLATLAQLRAFIGYSTDRNIVSAFPPPSVNDALLGSVFSDLKTIATLCGDTSFATDTRPYFPETPLIECAAIPQIAVQLNLIFLKLSLVEHDLQSVQKENHVLDTALLAGLSGLPDADPANGTECGADQPKDNNAGQTCDSYSKFTFIKFPFGLEEIERALYTMKTEGFDPLQIALGNKDQPNSLINALHMLTEGTEAQIDAFHQLGATWRYIADSIQNFAIFGVESARSILQWDVNAIDIDTAVKAAEVERAKSMATFMGTPVDDDGVKAIGQLVITFSTEAGAQKSLATDSQAGKATVALASMMLLGMLGLYGRFVWHVV